MATDSPGWRFASSVPCQPVGKMSASSENASSCSSPFGSFRVLVALREFQGVVVGVRHAKLLRLSARIRSHGDVAVRAAREAGVDVGTEPGVPLLAVLTESAGDVERHHHAVALLQRGDRLAHFGDDAHVLVSEHDSLLRRRSTLVHVEVGAADTGRGDVDHDVVRMFELRVVYLFDGHVVRALVYYCFHSVIRLNSLSQVF